MSDSDDRQDALRAALGELASGGTGPESPLDAQDLIRRSRRRRRPALIGATALGAAASAGVLALGIGVLPGMLGGGTMDTAGGAPESSETFMQEQEAPIGAQDSQAYRDADGGEPFQIADSLYCRTVDPNVSNSVGAESATTATSDLAIVNGVVTGTVSVSLRDPAATVTTMTFGTVVTIERDGVVAAVALSGESVRLEIEPAGTAVLDISLAVQLCPGQLLADGDYEVTTMIAVSAMVPSDIPAHVAAARQTIDIGAE